MEMEKKFQQLEARRSKYTISEPGHKLAINFTQPRYCLNPRTGHKTDSGTTDKVLPNNKKVQSAGIADRSVIA